MFAQSDNIVFSDAPSGAEWADGTTWFRLKISNGGYFSTSYMSSGEMSSDNTIVPDNHGLWCFVKNTDNTVSIYNCAEGTTKVLGTTKNIGSNGGAARTNVFDINSIPDNVETHYEYGNNGKGGYWLKLQSVDNGYLNKRSPFIAMWTNSGATNDVGSAITLTKVGVIESYNIIIPVGYHVRGNVYDDLIVNGGKVSLFGSPASSVVITDANDKFVWGPIIDTKAKTVKYEVRDRATELTNGWYQMQLSMPDADIVTLCNKIKDEEGNINTAANTLYLAPTVYDVSFSKQFKITGIPNYASQEATYVYIEKTSDNTLSITNTRTGAKMNGNFSFADNKLNVTSWAIDDAAHPLEGPNVGIGGSTLSFNLGAVDMTQYDLYKVVFDGDASSVQGVAINNSNAMGTTTLGNGSYLFMRKGSSAPVAEDFSVSKGIGAIIACNIAGGTITLTISEAKQAWTVKINDSNYKVVYNNTEYADGASVEIPESANPALAFKTTCTDKFVWGPIVDTENKTVTFEVREPATNLVAGKWYQLQLSPTASGRYYVPNETGNLVEGVLKMNPRNAGSQIYMIGANKTSGSWTTEFIGKPANEVETYLYINYRNGNTTQVMMQNSYYITDQSQYSSSAANTQFEYNSTTHEFHWRNPVYPWGSLNGMTAGVGKSSTADGPIKVIAYEVPVKAYKVSISSGSGSLVYMGDAEIIGSKHAAHGRFIFAKEGQELEGENASNIDISKFVLKGTEGIINSITASTSNGITTLNVIVTTPTYGKEIIHVQNRYYDYLETDANKPDEGFIQPDEGWNVRTGSSGVIREQNTSVFEIPVYLRQGTSFTSYLPTNELKSYQRWYDWDSDGQVSSAVFTPTWTISLAQTYTNGILSGDSYGGYHNDPRFTLPLGMDSYNVGLDLARFGNGGTRGNGSLVEPTIGMRVVYQIRDAKQIANAIKTVSDGGKFYEVHNISLPNMQYGSRASRLEDRTLSTTLPLDMDLNNYWGYRSGGTDDANLVQLTGDNQLRVELVNGSAPIKNVMMIPGSANANSGNISRTSFNSGHFVLFQYPDNGYIEPNSTATINVYMTSGDQEYKLAQFNLSFISNAHPVVVTELKDSGRHPDALKADFGSPVAELTFDQMPNSEYSTTEAGVTYPDYRYPLDYKGASYAFGARNGRNWAASRGEYALTSVSGSSTQTGTPRILFYPVVNYLRSMADPNAALGSRVDGAYQLYIDAADQPGKIASIELKNTLCAGSRLYCYGYIGCTSGGTSYHPTSVLINVMGINNTTGKEELIYSYCPGIITLRGYAEDGRTIYSTTMGNSSSYSQRSGAEDRNYWAPWQQIGFSFLIDATTAARMKGYSIQIMNNAYNSTGGDTMLDDFQIFVNPPKGSVDFTTPLCSDKVRHAKIHTDFDMLKNLSNVNETAEDPKITATYCFLDAEIFDRYEENGMKIADMFEMDDKGNHNLKSGYEEDNQDVKDIINHAFRQALVGSRYTKDSGKEDYGYHAYEIPLNYDSIEPYAYNDSKEDVVYREVDGQGVRRIVFKENVVRGEMQMIPAETGKEETHPAYWPYMRPSRTYYLVFSPILAKQDLIDLEETATSIFNIQGSCSFFGKFTTKDPMHVILDNADIESDLPVKAVCHGESVSFEFDMPVLKANKPIIDEAYCISDEGLNGQIVPSTNGAKHYRYEASFKDNDVMGVVKNMPYDWWLGGTLGGVKFGGKIEDYLVATHPTIKYQGPQDIANKQDNAPVKIAQAMTDFRFFYPDEDGSTWSSVVPREYNNDTGYGLLQSEINTIKDFVGAGIIVLHKNQYTMSLTAGKSENLTPNELSVMTSNELNSQILSLALTLDDDPAIAALKPLKDLEGATLGMISDDGRKELTFQEFAYESYERVKEIAVELSIDSSLPESELRKAVETALRAMAPDDLRNFAMTKFTDIGPERRAHLVIRALNIMNDETLAGMTESQKRDEAYVREVLRVKMIAIFSQQAPVVLRKMWRDVAAKLTAEERVELLRGKDPETMSESHLAVLLEQALAMITNNIIADLNSDKYIHFTLVPIMPSQENFVDEPYIFCPEPRGVKVRITSSKPQMLDGFADMLYPSEMTNVPMRIGLTQINDVPTAAGSKTLRVPLRKLEKAIVKEGHHLALAKKTDAPLYLVETDDPALKDGSTSSIVGLMQNSRFIQVGKIQALKAVFDGNDNYMDITFNAKDVHFPGFREGYTYRLSYEFIEEKQNNEPTISCSEWIYFDMKVVPEYQKWTGSVNSDWTNDWNWARADRDELNADNAATGEVIAGSTDITVEANYPTNAVNQTSNSFVPMYFTNVLVGDATNAPVLYTNKETEDSYAYTPASRSAKTFLRGLHSTATRNIVYDMEVAPSTGAWNADKNYECTLFGTYIANGITFQPGAQMGNTHYLIYNKAWVEYELDADRWYTLGSPLMKSVAGDWYSPTKGGKQLTPHFYDINYKPELNDRFRPAYYQRSWDRDGNNKVYEKSGGIYDSYVKADWSYVYNDATVDYSKGGFSVKAELGYMEGADRPVDSKVLVRLPKADTSYKYYDVEGQTGQATDAAIGDRSDSYRLLSDELKADGSGSISMKVSNTTADNNFLLLHNPFMAAMDMDEFFAKNTDLEPKYWIVDANKQMVSVKTADGWIATSEAGGRYVAPLQGFFVKKKDNLDAPNSISAAYNATMQTVMAPSPTQNNPNIRTRATSTGAADMIRLIAERDGASSTAVIMLGDGFSDGYVAGEDCETFVDGNLYDKPTVYTSAGSMAQTINVRKSLEMVPVGMISSDDSEVVLRFDLSESSYRTLYLYDGESNSFSEISDGAEVVMSGNNAGRYYLASIMSFEQLDAVDGGSQKGVWTLSGNYCGDSVDGLQPGLYIVDGVKMLIRK